MYFVQCTLSLNVFLYNVQFPLMKYEECAVSLDVQILCTLTTFPKFILCTVQFPCRIDQILYKEDYLLYT